MDPAARRREAQTNFRESRRRHDVLYGAERQYVAVEEIHAVSLQGVGR